MKRCPQCLFIYPDTDLVCDFDQTHLVAATEAEIAAVTNTAELPTYKASTPNQNRKNWRGLLLSGAIGLLLGMAIVGVYFAVHRQMTLQPSPQSDALSTSQPVSAPSPSPSATVIVQTAAPEPTVEATTKSPSLKTATAHSSTSTNPVSRSAPKGAGKSLILLTSGGKVEADEVWRTKDGIWYRRDGIVTLLKKARVKAIVRQ